jgi:hypothetical protein
MTKLFVQLLDEDATESEVLDAIITNDSYFVEKSFDALMALIEDDGELPSGSVFVFELVDKGKIETSHKFVSSKKVKNVNPA